jgi:hypothetical protein
MGLDGTALSVDGGTSLAAPQVSAVLAAVRAYQPSLTRQQAEDTLRATAVPGAGGTLRIDAAAVFRAAGLGAMAAPTPAAPQAPGVASLQAVASAPTLAFPRPLIRRQTRRRGSLQVELAAIPRGTRTLWGGARARAIGRRRIEFALGPKPRRAWIALSGPGGQLSPRVAIALPARRSLS